MMILLLKTVIFKCLYEYRCLVLPHHDSTFKVVIFHAWCAELSLTFPNLPGKFNYGVFVGSKKKNWKKKKKLKKKKKKLNFFWIFFSKYMKKTKTKIAGFILCIRIHILQVILQNTALIATPKNISNWTMITWKKSCKTWNL